MMKVNVRLDNNTHAFFALVRAGLWEKEVRLAPYGEIDYAEVLRLAEEQAVVGLIAAGIEHIVDGRPAKRDVLRFIGRVTQIEQRNQAMNFFIGVIADKMREAGIYSVLVKGQGVAQCYERPLWRASGDVDLLLDAENYEKAKEFLIPQSTEVEKEFSYLKHVALHFDPWEIELHGRFRSRLSQRIDNELDSLFDCCLTGGEVRVWHNDTTDVYLPSPDIDVLFSFTHLLRHFFFEGVGLRQICDWCRLLWTYRDSLNRELLERRLQKMRLVSEWKAFGAFAVEWLGMPVEAMPMLNEKDNSTASTGFATGSSQVNDNLKKKANRIGRFVMKVGNFGHNQAVQGSKTTRRISSFFLRKVASSFERFGFVLRHFPIFPLDSLRFFWQVLVSGIEMAVKDER